MPDKIATAFILLERAEKRLAHLQKTLTQLDRLHVPVYWYLPSNVLQQAQFLFYQLQASKKELTEMACEYVKEKKNCGQKGKQKS